MDKKFIKYFSWVDVHDIYYILKINNQIQNIPFLTRMTHNWTKTNTMNMNIAKSSKIYRKDVINGYVHVGKYHNT